MGSLYLLSPPEGDFFRYLPGLFETGVEQFQYRRPELSDRAQLTELRQLKSITDHYDVQLIVNDRPDLALAAEATGVHLGSADLTPETVKEEWPELLVGITQRAAEPLVPGADYYSVGPVYAPRSKKLDVEPCGWSGVRSVLEQTDRPVYAIGGLTPGRLSEAPASLDAAAVISGVWSNDSPVAAARRLATAF